MKLALYQVDAFAAHVFEGNPAGVCPLTTWLPDALMQAIAAENNLAETAFFVPEPVGDAVEYRLRWFTPMTEVDLCGHATLASAHVLFESLGHAAPQIVFHTRSGALTVRRQGTGLAMDFPASRPQRVTPPPALLEGLGGTPVAVWAAEDYLVVYDSEAEVRALSPDLKALATLDRRGVCATAPGEQVDFVSRFFAPRVGIDEDPVTGSAHCQLAPLWADALGRTALRARQISRRGGNVGCEVVGDRVVLTGAAVTYLVGTIDTGPD